MTKTEIKHKAQDEIMHAIGGRFTTLADYEELTPELRDAMDAQMRRIEKLFGYDPGSWLRGC